MRLEGKRAIITAAGSGMGRAGAELFAREGATLALIDIDAARLDAAVSAIRTSGGNAYGIVADLSRDEETVRCIDEAVAHLRGVDILWNHAGIPGQGAITGIDMALYRRSLDLNLTSGIVATQQVLPHMRGSGGSIVFTSSIAGLVGSALSPIYSAAKFAVVGYVKALACRVAAQRIRVNAVCPGPIETAMFPDFLTSDARFSTDENRARIIASVPMSRIGEPVEAAHVALWLASDDASYVTGTAIPVDGGLTAR
jgi:NAD(P)-dependent dehydrogenase (short-subunit alcohol dehydrogenase family)